MTIGKQKCKICNKLYRCKLQSTPHVHAEINGVKIIATIHEDDVSIFSLSKLYVKLTKIIMYTENYLI